MIVLLNQSGNTTYGLRKYILDTEADVENLPTENILMGSEATVIDSGKKYNSVLKGRNGFQISPLRVEALRTLAAPENRLKSLLLMV